MYKIMLQTSFYKKVLFSREGDKMAINDLAQSQVAEYEYLRELLEDGWLGDKKPKFGDGNLTRNALPDGWFEYIGFTTDEIETFRNENILTSNERRTLLKLLKNNRS